MYLNTQQGEINFFESKIAPWTNDAAAIDTTTGAVTALGKLVSSAQSSIAARVAAQSTATTASAAADLAIDAMTTARMDIVSAIRTKARTGGDNVYILAQIPAPATGSAMGAPGELTNIKGKLENNGGVVDFADLTILARHYGLNLRYV